MSTAQRTPIHLGALEIRFLVEPDDSAGSVSVFECDVPAGARVPAPHSHDAFDETIYGVRGVTTWTVDGASSEVGPGRAIHVARGQVHGFQNRHDEDATFLAIATPAVLGPDYFRNLSAVLSAGGPPDMAAVHDVMRRHGLTPATGGS